MQGSKQLVAAAVVAITVSGTSVIGQMMGTRSAEASSTRSYTLRLGDKVAIPAINQVCAVEAEGGAADLFCTNWRSTNA